nr:MAG TPA: hypothetical protein [Caudoviricetes sp.]DAY38102.1 MAG TPA: hypothetical protein [Caudoviricetes sp.]
MSVWHSDGYTLFLCSYLGVRIEFFGFSINSFNSHTFYCVSIVKLL